MAAKHGKTLSLMDLSIVDSVDESVSDETRSVTLLGGAARAQSVDECREVSELLSVRTTLLNEAKLDLGRAQRELVKLSDAALGETVDGRYVPIATPLDEGGLCKRNISNV